MLGAIRRHQGVSEGIRGCRVVRVFWGLAGSVGTHRLEGV